MKQWVENVEKEHRIEMLHNMDVALLFMHRITLGYVSVRLRIYEAPYPRLVGIWGFPKFGRAF